MPSPNIAFGEPEFDFTALTSKIEPAAINDILEAHVKSAYDDLTQKLWDAIELYLADDVATNLEYRARAVAERYIAEALAGDNDKLRRVFGISNYAPQPWALVDGNTPKSWELLRLLADSDMLRNELIDEQAMEIAALRDEVARLRTAQKDGL